MNKPARRTIDAAIALGLAGLVFLVARDPSTPQPDPTPAETFSHVEVTVDDAGVTASPERVDAGHIEFTVVDRRTNQDEKLLIRSEPPGIQTSGGSSLTELRALGHYVLVAEVDEKALQSSSAIDVAVPQLAAPNEPADRVTLDLRDDLLFSPKREARRDMPIPSPAASFKALEHQPWTTVASGPTSIIVRNRTDQSQRCEVAGESVDVAAGERATLTASFDREPVGAYELICGDRSFGFWVT